MKFSMGPVGPQLLVQVASSHEIWDDSPIFAEDSDVQVEADTSEDRKMKRKPSKKGYHLKQNAKGSGDKACASTVMEMEISRDMFLVGDIFMRKFYTVFDRDNDRVGLAEANTSDKVKALGEKK